MIDHPLVANVDRAGLTGGSIATVAVALAKSCTIPLIAVWHDVEAFV